MTDGNSAYDKLAVRMGAPGSVRFAKILEAMMPPDEADILVDVSSPTTAAWSLIPCLTGEGVSYGIS